jgi:hypothetical protein
MTMNRRSLLGAGLGVAAASLLPLPAQAQTATTNSGTGTLPLRTDRRMLGSLEVSASREPMITHT